MNMLVIVCLGSCLPVSPLSPVVLLYPAASTFVTRYVRTYVPTYIHKSALVCSTGRPFLAVALPAPVLHSGPCLIAVICVFFSLSMSADLSHGIVWRLPQIWF